MYNTGNPIGSTDARDLSDNAQTLDKAVNSSDPTFVDRLGNTRPTLAGTAPYAGPAYDVSNYASLAAAVAAFPSTPATIQFGTDQTLAANFVCPAHVELLPLNGAKINHGAYTLTINSSTSRWPDSQIFVGSGAVRFPTAFCKIVPAVWFGATGDYATNPANNDGPAIIRAIASIARVNGSDYFRGSAVKLHGLSRSTQTIYPPYGVGLVGDAPGNTNLFIDADASTDGVVFDAAISNGESFLSGCLLRDIQIASVSSSTSRDLVVLNGVSSFRFDNVNVVGAGRYGVKIFDSVDVRGVNVRVIGSGVNNLNVNTAGASVNTTTSFKDSFFINAAGGYSAVVAGLGINFDNTYFEYSVGGGIKVNSGTCLLNGCYWEGNSAGNNIYVGGSSDATLRANTAVTIVGPHFVANSPAGEYNLYLNGGTVNLVGGDYRTTAMSVYVNNVNFTAFNSIGAYIGTPVLATGSNNDLLGASTVQDASGVYWRTGKTGTTLTTSNGVNSAATISALSNVFHVLNATTPIATITAPFAGFRGQITLIPDAAFTTTTAGNIAIASTAVIGKAMVMTYDGTKWYPSY